MSSPQINIKLGLFGTIFVVGIILVVLSILTKGMTYSSSIGWLGGFLTILAVTLGILFGRD